MVSTRASTCMTSLAVQTLERKKILAEMSPALQRVQQNLCADDAVGDAIATVGHGEMHAAAMLRMRSEERQSVRGFRERAGPREGSAQGQGRQQSGALPFEHAGL